jgi:hypothetical protein
MTQALYAYMNNKKIKRKNKKIKENSRSAVAYFYNPSYVADRDWED